MISESKYSKNGVITSASQSATNPNIKHSANANLNHQHLNLHHHQYNQPSIKSIINYNNNNDSSINTKDYTNSSYDAYNNNVITKNSNDSTSTSSSNHHQHHHHHHRQNNNKHLNSCSSSSTSSTGSVNVKFTGFFKDKIDEREKYLTAKYPNHQMALIKKRLKVEFWIDEQLKNLFNITVGFF